ncbi:MFS transporter [Jeotgalibacillus sp. R-1-5s-1]|uniref:MFS transporter n=1 Tax=Jeotgalibacillus sp. R-1-5s-1 TaxID=2555897 RepID=UPI00106A5488|nr:MFS transporter [Jeotgalibacillus sp. R-1-5s-1]TFD99859.1 MFS transporter [Jeotgalibacillus sp. R-1-5s-1]
MDGLALNHQGQVSLFRNKNFMLLFYGKFVSQLGDVIYNIAVGWYILSITASAIETAVFMALGAVVYLLAAPYGGVMADKVSRKWLMVMTDLIRGGVMGIACLIMFIGIESIWIFYVLAIILSVCGALFVPASNALIPLLVKEEQLTKANSMSASIQSVTNIFGLIAGGVLYTMLGVVGVLMLNGLSYTLSGISEMFIEDVQSSNNEKPQRSSVFRDFGESMIYLKQKEGFYSLILVFGLINLLITPVFAVYTPYIFNQILKTDPLQYSFVGVAAAVGFLIGAGVLSALKTSGVIHRKIKMGLLLLSMIFVFILGLMIFYSSGFIESSSVVTFFIVAAVIVGFSEAFIFIPVNVAVQKLPNHLLGRISSLIQTLVMISVPIGLVAGGVVTDLFDMTTVLLVTTGLFILLTVSLFKVKSISSI